MDDDRGTVDEASARGRSTIQFPYHDLSNAIELVGALHAHARDCTPDQLAAWLPGDISVGSGGFRARVTAAQIYGLLVRHRGMLAVTDLADRILDPIDALPARVDAFLKVPLFEAVYEEFTGKRLPPSHALEQHITQLGVAPKQAGRARQALMRSAAQAGFLDASGDRLVKPATSGTRSADPLDDGEGVPPPSPSPITAVAPADPMLRGLFERLPPAGSQWSHEGRKHWMRAADSIFTLVYGAVEPPNVDGEAARPAPDSDERAEAAAVEMARGG